MVEGSPLVRTEMNGGGVSSGEDVVVSGSVGVERISGEWRIDGSTEDLAHQCHNLRLHQHQGQQNYRPTEHQAQSP